MTTITWNTETEEIVHVDEFSPHPEAWEHIQEYKEGSPYLVYRYLVAGGNWRVITPKHGFIWHAVNEADVPDVVKLAGTIADF